MTSDYFGACDILKTSRGEYIIYHLNKLESSGSIQLSHLPYSIRIMLESVLRQCNEREITQQDVINLANWKPRAERVSLPFLPGRVIMQDFTGVPAVVDLAAMRSAAIRIGVDPNQINPLIPVDLVIDHSVQVDFFATPDALQRNAELEFQRNRERYEFLHWGQQAFSNFRVVPPATGIVHQINLEYLGQGILCRKEEDKTIAFPDTVVGTDSHTTMINGLGILGWGVGGIEAEAAMLGQPIDMLIPDVIGVKLHSKLQAGVTATDLVLTITQILRSKSVVGKFVEFYGSGLDSISLPDRATIANMAPEYGATTGFFPVDAETLRYYHLSNRPPELIELIERYCKAQGLFRDNNSPDPDFTDTLELDLASVEPCLAGPKRPQDRIPLKEIKRSFFNTLRAPLKERGYALSEQNISRKSICGTNGSSIELGHGTIVLAAITSCTNTSNPSVMISAGLLAKKAIERGLKVKPYVKTSLAPGSRIVTAYLQAAGLIDPLATLGFDLVGYGCTTCIGNSGPLSAEVVKTISNADLVAVAILSGNRNFEGRIHPFVQANYLASPPLVVAYAIAGRIDIDLFQEPLGYDQYDLPVYLSDIWPSSLEIQNAIDQNLRPEIFAEQYANVFSGNSAWNDIHSNNQDIFVWDEHSTYIQEPPFFENLSLEVTPRQNIYGARVLASLGDSITTDHISPAGSIAASSPAGKYLISCGVDGRDFNSYGSRRGNDRVMVRGTFANIRLKNRLIPGVEGGYTLYFPSGETMSIFDAASQYKQEQIPLLILAGKEYGSGSSRDWAAKGTMLLGVKAVLAESYERIHRSNLIGMGILPLQYFEGQNADSLGLTGSEIFNITGIDADLKPHTFVKIEAIKSDGGINTFQAIARLDTPIEVDYYQNGGILPTVLRNMAKK